MQDRTVTQEPAHGIGHVVPGRGYARIMAGGRTLVYANKRRAGIEFDFRAADVADAPARLRWRTTLRRDRALLSLGGQNDATHKSRVRAARTLLEHVAQKGWT